MLRHMFITQLYNKGVDIKVTQLLAGHANYQTTADIYTELDHDKTSDFVTTNLYNWEIFDTHFDTFLEYF